MALETGSYISDLEPLNPASTDLLKQADDHLRLIKSCLQNTFPNITGPVTKTQDEINNPVSDVPVGSILMWYGADTAVPSGYAICNGQLANRTDGSGTIQTPDLRDRIPMGVGNTLAAIGDTAGSLTDTATSTAAGAHSHTIGDHTHSVTGNTADATTGITLSETRQQVEASNPSQDATDSVTLTDPGHHHALDLATTAAGAGDTSAALDHTHDVTVDTLPPVIGLHFIMKV